jgi:predicted MFS family arabinose efflux permease
MDGSVPPNSASGQEKRANMRGGLLARTALMLGNFVIGVGVLAPAGMLDQLATGLEVSIADAGLLVTYGAVVLCFGSPLMAWATSRLDRRTLLGGTLLIFALGHAAAALAPSYGTLLASRLVMLVFAAVYTPQAASTVALIVPEKARSSAIAFVFLGWSLAVAVGLPIVTTVADHFGWRATFAMLGGFAAVSFALLVLTLPPGLKGAPVSFATWAAVGRSRLILLLLAITVLQTAGPFMIFTYLAPLAKDLASASTEEVALLFALGGVTGFVGNLIATRLVFGWGAFRVSLIFQLIMLCGLVAWSLGAGMLAVMAFGIGLWGLGFAALNSMQQARLVGADPKLASASVALNTSSIYVGQAIGSGAGGWLFTHGHHHLMGYAAIAFLLAALGTIGLTRPKVAT